MEVLTVGQILSSVPGKFYGDESIRGTTVSNITHRISDIKEGSVYVLPLNQENPEEFLLNNLTDITDRGVSLVVTQNVISPP